MEDPHFAQASALIDSVVDRVLQVVAQTTGWEALDSQEGVSGGKIPAGESSLQVRVQTVINKTPEQIHAFLWDYTNKPKWSDEIKEIRLVKQLGDHMRILYEHHGAPWPVSDRDLVLASRYVERPDGILIINKSIDIGLPEVDGGLLGRTWSLDRCISGEAEIVPLNSHLLGAWIRRDRSPILLLTMGHKSKSPKSSL